jgi:Spy/CpxP family protein refolding chaperone
MESPSGSTTEQEENVIMTAQNPTPETNVVKAPRRGLRRWSWLMLALPLMLGGVAYNAANAYAFPGHGDGAGQHERMQARLDRILSDAGASDAQKAQVKSIWANLGPQLKAARQQHMQIRQQIGQALAAPTIDTNAIEKLRQQSLQAIDNSSKLLTQGMVQTAQVLTPDQRQKVLSELHRHGHHHPGLDAGE